MLTGARRFQRSGVYFALLQWPSNRPRSCSEGSQLCVVEAEPCDLDYLGKHQWVDFSVISLSTKTENELSEPGWLGRSSLTGAGQCAKY